ncbi:MAG: tripartite tricarboxylate transporter substrate binding protein [Bullifex sp.]
MKKCLVTLLMVMLLASSIFAQGASEASAYPSKTVEATVGWAAGGGGDIVFRALADVFPKYANGQTMVIKNVAGASGITGAVEFLDASADGYSIMHWNNATMAKTHLSDTVITGADTFRTVCQVVSSYNYLVVRADSKYQSLQEFIADAKANPGVITCGNAGANGGNHLAALIFQNETGLNLTHVPYSGGGPAITGLLAGEVDCVMANAPEGIANVQNGQLRILAVFSDNRYTAFPEVPTGKECGVDCVLPQWRTVVVPKDTPDEIVNKLADIIKQCTEDPAFIDAMTSLSVEVTYKGPSDAAAFMKSEDARFAELAKTL